MINPSLLQTFCTLVEVEHFTKTAERLHMTQSGVTQHIHKLENQLDQPLLLRKGKGSGIGKPKPFTLTDAGSRLYKEAKKILNAMADLEAQLKEDPAFEGNVKIMSPGSIGLKLHPELVALQKKHPDLCIEHRFAPNTDVEKAITNGDCDIGFMTKPSTEDALWCEPVAKEELLLVTPSTKSTLNWQLLQMLGYVNHPDGAHHASLLLGENFTEFKGFNDLKVNGFSNQIHLILDPVAAGIGFTVFPAYAVEAFNKPKKIKIHQLRKSVFETVYLCRNQNRPQLNRMQSVIEAITQVLN